MPNRIIRESALTSPTLDMLSHGAERMWWRLTVVVDDYGRFDADPRVVRSRCFPMKNNLGRREVEGWVEEMAVAGLIQRYRHGDHTYGVIVQWTKHQRAGRSKPKFPGPDDPGSTPVDAVAAICGDLRQPAASCGLESRVVIRDTRDENREIETAPTEGGRKPGLSLSDIWNTLPHPPFAHVKTISTGRAKKIRIRLSEHPSEEFWSQVVTTIGASSFCRGGAGWTATFDWLIDNPDNCVKVYEGNYDDRVSRNGRIHPADSPPVDGHAVPSAEATRARMDAMIASIGKPMPA